MSNLWRQSAGAWEAMPLPGEADRIVPLAGHVAVVAFGRGADRVVVLLARPGAVVRVNGLPMLGGLRLLDHQDEILIGRERFYFSGKSTPRVTVFRHEGDGRRPACPVCRGPLIDGEDAVQCPGCGRWYHQSEPREGARGRPCFTYADQCRFCSHPTKLSGETVWRPDGDDAHV